MMPVFPISRKVFYLAIVLALAVVLFLSHSNFSGLNIGGAVVSSRTSVDAAPPNILFILADDLGVDMLNAYHVGTDLPNTPVLDALASQGVVFKHAYSNPVCCPTRSTIMTGRYSARTGIGKILDYDTFNAAELQASDLTLPEALKLGTRGKYVTAAFGKWHLNNMNIAENYNLDAPRTVAQFDHYSGTIWNLSDIGGTYFSYPKVVNGQVVQSNKYATTDQVDDALSWINSQSKSWFVYLAFNAPHWPYHMPPANLHTQPNVSTCTGAVNRRICYKAAIEAMDKEIGRLLEGIPPSVLKNTMIVFTADNGTPDLMIKPPFTPGRGKGSVFQEGINVPLIVKGPLARQGLTSTALINTTDFLATFAEMAGFRAAALLPPGKKYDSVSFLLNLKNPSLPSSRTFAFSEIFSPLGKEYAQPQPQPSIPYAQPDLGMQGPGTLQIAIRGDSLGLGNTASLEISGALPLSDVDVYRSSVNDPVSMFGGTIITSDPERIYTYTTDASGSLTVPDFIVNDYEDTTKQLDYYYQAIQPDGSQAQGYQISNAIHVEFQKPNIKMIRETCYKLIKSFNGNPQIQRLYNVCTDPFEQTNLYPPAAGSVEETKYNWLNTQMNSLLADAQQNQ